MKRSRPSLAAAATTRGETVAFLILPRNANSTRRSPNAAQNRPTPPSAAQETPNGAASASSAKLERGKDAVLTLR